MRKFVAISLFALPLLASLSGQRSNIEQLSSSIFNANKEGLDYVMVQNPGWYRNNEESIIKIGYSSTKYFTRMVVSLRFNDRTRTIYDKTFLKKITKFNELIKISSANSKGYNQTTSEIIIKTYFDKVVVPETTTIYIPEGRILHTISPVTTSALKEDEYYEFGECGFVYYHKTGTWYSLKDYFSFDVENTQSDAVTLDYYNRLDLDSVVIYGNSNYGELPPIDVARCELLLYPYIDPVGANSITLFGTTNITMLDLDVYKIDDYSFGVRAKQNFYVDPITKEMSLEEKEGYVKTKYIYYPNYCAQESVKFLTQLTIYNIGYSRANYKIIRDCYANPKAYFSNCNEGEYCVTSESSTPDFDIGSQLNA